MIEGLNPYPKMKASGIGWLGTMPAHWHLRRMKTLLRERVEKGYPNEPLLAATQTKGVVLKQEYETRTVVATKDLHLLKLVRVGDFVISLRSFQGGLECARQQGIISPAYTVLYPIDVATHAYLARIFKSLPYIDNLALYVTGIRQGQNIDYEKLSRSDLPFPPLAEQAAIVRFLDYADSRIRSSVLAKRKRIRLLGEQKQTIINQAVTRGINSQVRLAPTGVELLGQVPKHWEVLRGKCLFREVDERSQTGEEELLSVSHLTGVTPRSVKQITMFKAESYVGSKLCRPGDIAINTMWAWMGPVGVSRFYGIVSPSYHTYRQRTPHRYDERFLDLLLRTPTYKTLYRTASTGITSSRMRLYPERFLCLPFVCPPLVEQKAIVATLELETRQIDAALISATREVDLLQELRDRLIADVVTGQLDIREVAAQLPADDFKGDDPLDDTDGEEEDDSPVESGVEDGDGG